MTALLRLRSDRRSQDVHYVVGRGNRLSASRSHHRPQIRVLLLHFVQAARCRHTTDEVTGDDGPIMLREERFSLRLGRLLQCRKVHLLLPEPLLGWTVLRFVNDNVG